MARDPAKSLAPARIPRYVQRLAEYGEARGIETDFRVARYSLEDDDPGQRLFMNWRASRQHFLSLDLLTPGHRVPSICGYFRVPEGMNRYRQETALLTGYITVSGRDLLWEIDTGPAEFTIEQHGAIEVVTYADRIVYHGTLEALIAAGIDPKRIPTGKKPAKTERWTNDIVPEEWCSRRQPDGFIVYRVETEAARQKRFAKRERDMREMREAREPMRTAEPGLTSETARRAYCREQIEKLARGFEGMVCAYIGELEPNILEKHGLRWRTDARVSIRELAENFAKQMGQLLRAAPFESAKRNALRLVVDNTARSDLCPTP